MSDSKRVLILTADAGFGHRSAANAVAVALQETYGEECAVEIVNPLEDKRIPSVLRNSQTDYDRIVRDMPSLYEFGYKASDATVPSAMVESLLAVMLFEVTRELIRQRQPDVVVTTYPFYQAPLSVVRAVGKRYIPLITIVTDLATVHRTWFSKAIDLCLVPTEAVRDMGMAFGLAPDQVKVTGIPVYPSISREARDRAVICAELGWRPDLTTVLVVGSKRVGCLTDVLRVLNHSGLPLQLAIVAGKDRELYRQLQGTVWHVAAHTYEFVTNMPTLMRAADCILCKAGGMIVTEALASGLPLLLVHVLPGQEAGNAEYVIRGGAGELAEDPVAALEILCHWLDKGGALLAERAQNARRLGRPDAAYKVAEQVWAAAERGFTARAFRGAIKRRKIAFSRRGVPGEWRGS